MRPTSHLWRSVAVGPRGTVLGAAVARSSRGEATHRQSWLARRPPGQSAIRSVSDGGLDRLSLFRPQHTAVPSTRIAHE